MEKNAVIVRRESSGRRAKDDRGAALVEAALVLPFLVLMVFGIVELGFLFRSASVTNSSTRAGVRLAAANYGAARNAAEQSTVIDNVRLSVEKEISSRGSTDTPVRLWVYKSDPNGKPLNGDFSACSAPCFQFTWNSSAGRFQLASGNWAAPDACGTVHDTIGVYVRMSHAPIGFTAFLGTLTIDEHSVMRVEAPPPGSSVACAEGS